MQNGNRSGFTLVELMVVVAVIGILVSVALPQYQKLQARSRMVEAKISLGTAAAMESALQAEKGSFTLCLGQIGYAAPTGKTYYTVGFPPAVGSSFTPTGSCCNSTICPSTPTVAGGFCDFSDWSPNAIRCDCTVAGGEGSCFFRANTDAYQVASFNRNANLYPQGNNYRSLYDVITPHMDATAPFAELSSQTFVLQAMGAIYDLTLPDRPTQPMEFVRKTDIWTINQDRSLRQVQNGTGGR